MRKMRLGTVAGLALTGACLGGMDATPAFADDREQIKIFATMLGRAIGCQLPLYKDASQEVSAWMEQRLPSDTLERTKIMRSFAADTIAGAREQRDGKNVQPCEQVAAYFTSSEYRDAIAP